MDAENIGKPKNYMADVHRVANVVGLRMPNEKKEWFYIIKLYFNFFIFVVVNLKF